MIHLRVDDMPPPTAAPGQGARRNRIYGVTRYGRLSKQHGESGQYYSIRKEEYRRREK